MIRALDADALVDAWRFGRSPEEREYLLRQIGHPHSHAWRLWDDRYGTVALVGLYSCDRGKQEAWFIPTGYASRVMLHMLRTIAELLRAYAPPSFYETRCIVNPGHAPGERLARLLGFEPTGEIFNAPGTPVHGVQFWRYCP